MTALFGSIDHVNNVMRERRVKEGHLIGDTSRLPVAWQNTSIDFFLCPTCFFSFFLGRTEEVLAEEKNMLAMQYPTVVTNVNN